MRQCPYAVAIGHVLGIATDNRIAAPTNGYLTRRSITRHRRVTSVAYQFGTLEETANHKVRSLNFPIFKAGKAKPSGIVNFPPRIGVMTGQLACAFRQFQQLFETRPGCISPWSNRVSLNPRAYFCQILPYLLPSCAIACLSLYLPCSFDKAHNRLIFSLGSLK